MKTAAALAYFAEQGITKYRLAHLLGIKPQSMQLWGERVPDLRQFQLEELSGGELKVEARLRPWPRETASSLKRLKRSSDPTSKS